MSDTENKRDRQQRRIANFVETIVMLAVTMLPYNEAMAAFRCAATLMEQVNATPNAPDESIEQLAQAVVDAELAKGDIA